MVQIIGRIYRIVSSECDGTYIGSTTQQLNMRFSGHKSHYKMYLAGNMNYLTSFEVLKFTDAKIELIHEGLFDGKTDLEKFEGDTIRTTPNAVNKIVAGRSMQEYYEYNKEAILARKNTKCTCATCGGKYTLASKAKHFRTKKHRDATSSSESSISSEQFQTDQEGEEHEEEEQDEPILEHPRTKKHYHNNNFENSRRRFFEGF